MYSIFLSVAIVYWLYGVGFFLTHEDFRPKRGYGLSQKLSLIFNSVLWPIAVCIIAILSPIWYVIIKGAEHD